MATTFAPRDIQDLHGEINVLRYLPLPVMIRAADGASTAALSRVLHAAATAAAPVELSVATRELAAAAEREGVAKRDIRVEDARTFAARIDTLEHSRIRLLGSADAQLREAIAARVEVALYDAPVVTSGRVELLTFLREQAISATDHRYGNPLPEQLDLTGGLGWERGAP